MTVKSLKICDKVIFKSHLHGFTACLHNVAFLKLVDAKPNKHFDELWPDQSFVRVKHGSLDSPITGNHIEVDVS